MLICDQKAKIIRDMLHTIEEHQITDPEEIREILKDRLEELSE